MPAFTPQNPDFEAHVRESFTRLTLMRTIGGALLRVAPGEIEIDLPFREDLTQHHGFMAAAVLTAIADVACGYAAMSLMPAGASPLTVEYKVNFVSPAQG
ncbi:MAG: PaaI family thioesterase, partial [Terriglobales bacterium]